MTRRQTSTCKHTKDVLKKSTSIITCTQPVRPPPVKKQPRAPLSVMLVMVLSMEGGPRGGGERTIAITPCDSEIRVFDYYARVSKSGAVGTTDPEHLERVPQPDMAERGRAG